MNRKYILACALAALSVTSACDNIWLEKQVPDAVKVSFVEHYPGIDQADWEKVNGLYEAEFEISGRERLALFQEDGKLVRYAEEIEERYLPATILEKLQAQYSNFKIDEVYRIQEADRTTFLVELEDNLKDKELHFSESGELLKENPSSTSGKVQPQSASLLPTATGSETINDLGMADARWELPAILREVSGIAMLSDGKIACVQDEEGKIFLYDLDAKKIVEEISFGGPGDYEGIAIAGSTAYVLRSDGAIFEVTDFRNGKPKVSLYEASFQATINMEGLAYDKNNGRLLLASKGFDKRLVDTKGLYAFDLAGKKHQPNATIQISLDQVKPGKSTKKKKSAQESLQPSSLELHPETGELYLLDAVNNRLYVLDQEGTILKTADLDKKLLRQAEGLTFDTEGALYIASEGGRKGNGVIVKYAGEI